MAVIFVVFLFYYYTGGFNLPIGCMVSKGTGERYASAGRLLLNNTLFLSRLPDFCIKILPLCA